MTCPELLTALTFVVSGAQRCFLGSALPDRPPGQVSLSRHLRCGPPLPLHEGQGRGEEGGEEEGHGRGEEEEDADPAGPLGGHVLQASEGLGQPESLPWQPAPPPSPVLRGAPLAGREGEVRDALLPGELLHERGSEGKGPRSRQLEERGSGCLEETGSQEVAMSAGCGRRHCNHF